MVLIDTVAIVVSTPITVVGGGTDPNVYAKFEVGLGKLNTLHYSMCTMTVGSNASGFIVGTFDLTNLIWNPPGPGTTLGGQDLSIIVDGGSPISHTFADPIASPSAFCTLASGIYTGSTFSLDVNNHLIITSNSTGLGSTIQVVGGTACPYLGLTPGQASAPVLNRTFANVSGDAVFGSDLNVSVNEDWPAGKVLGSWFAVDGDSKKAVISAPYSVANDDRLIVKSTYKASGVRALSSGNATVYFSGRVMPAF